ncbi:MAG: hypothetical protein IPK67_19610, partial [Planctomycetes bacterium]|nr:hypothetical protein [Planctomycetota bacterium]
MPRTLASTSPALAITSANRTARRRVVFRDPSDLARFQRLLRRAARPLRRPRPRLGADGNHFHLMLETPPGRLPAVMARLGGDLARKTNAAHGWDGPLFRGRYLNREVLDDA